VVVAAAASQNVMLSRAALGAGPALGPSKAAGNLPPSFRIHDSVAWVLSYADRRVLLLVPPSQKLVEKLKKERFRAVFDYLCRGEAEAPLNLLEVVQVGGTHGTGQAFEGLNAATALGT
jgi:hypothetical protein